MHPLVPGEGRDRGPIAFTAGHCDRQGFADRPYFTRKAELFSSSGDSGAPAYVKLGNDEVAVVAILRGSPEDDDGYTEFALIAPILDATGATLTGDIAPSNK